MAEGKSAAGGERRGRKIALVPAIIVISRKARLRAPERIMFRSVEFASRKSYTYLL